MPDSLFGHVLANSEHAHQTGMTDPGLRTGQASIGQCKCMRVLDWAQDPKTKVAELADSQSMPGGGVTYNDRPTPQGHISSIHSRPAHRVGHTGGGVRGIPWTPNTALGLDLHPVSTISSFSGHHMAKQTCSLGGYCEGETGTSMLGHRGTPTHNALFPVAIASRNTPLLKTNAGHLSQIGGGDATETPPSPYCVEKGRGS
jgi:hypothetical protein